MSQNVARPDSLRGTKSSGGTSSKEQRRRASQLKVGAKLAYDAGKANFKFVSWGGMTIVYGAMWVGGKTLEGLSMAGQAIGGGIVRVANRIRNVTIWLFQ